jgi:hypothetical protein
MTKNTNMNKFKAPEAHRFGSEFYHHFDHVGPNSTKEEYSNALKELRDEYKDESAPRIQYKGTLEKEYISIYIDPSKVKKEIVCILSPFFRLRNPDLKYSVESWDLREECDLVTWEQISTLSGFTYSEIMKLTAQGLNVLRSDSLFDEKQYNTFYSLLESNNIYAPGQSEFPGLLTEDIRSTFLDYSVDEVIVSDELASKVYLEKTSEVESDNLMVDGSIVAFDRSMYYFYLYEEFCFYLVADRQRVNEILSKYNFESMDYDEYKKHISYDQFLDKS